KIEAQLRELGEATRPPATFMVDVMRRIEALPARGAAAIDFARVTRRLVYRVAAVVALAAGVAAVVIVTHDRRGAGAPGGMATLATGPVVRAMTHPVPNLADYRR